MASNRFQLLPWTQCSDVLGDEDEVELMPFNKWMLMATTDDGDGAQWDRRQLGRAGLFDCGRAGVELKDLMGRRLRACMLGEYADTVRRWLWWGCWLW